MGSDRENVSGTRTDIGSVLLEWLVWGPPSLT